MGQVGFSLKRLYYPANQTWGNIPTAPATMARRRRSMKGLDNAACHLFRPINEAWCVRFGSGEKLIVKFNPLVLLQSSDAPSERDETSSRSERRPLFK